MKEMILLTLIIDCVILAVMVKYYVKKAKLQKTLSEDNKDV